MATKGKARDGRSGIAEVGARVGQTLETSVTQPPGWQEIAWDAALLGATVVEAVSPPVAIAGMALNRVIHAVR